MVSETKLLVAFAPIATLDGAVKACRAAELDSQVVVNVARSAHDLCRDHLPRALFRAPTLGEIGVLLECPLHSGSQDVAVEVFARIRSAAAQPGRRQLAGYLVEQHVVRDHETRLPSGVPAPGLKMLSLGLHNPSISLEEAVDHWRNVHPPLALRHHVGMTRYAQDLVVARLGSARPEVEMLAELSFPSVPAFTEGFVDSDEGRKIIANDAARFTGGGDTHFFTETVIDLGKPREGQLPGDGDATRG